MEDHYTCEQFRIFSVTVRSLHSLAMGRLSFEGESDGIMYRWVKDVDTFFSTVLNSSILVTCSCRDFTHYSHWKLMIPVVQLP